MNSDRSPRTILKFGVYDDDRPVFDWMRRVVPAGQSARRRCIEAQVMDVADDVAYSVHDLEDGIVVGKVDLSALDEVGERHEVWETVRSWYLPAESDEALDDAFGQLRSVAAWPDTPYDGTRRALAGLKNLTSDLIGIFCGRIQTATQTAYGVGPLVRHQGELVVPAQTVRAIGILKGVAAHYVMQAEERLALQIRQRDLLVELHAGLVAGAPDTLDPAFAVDFKAAGDDRTRARVLIDQIASLTDASALAWHTRLTA